LDVRAFVVDIRGTKEGIKYYTLKYTLAEPVQGTFYEKYV
jgi:NMD protein affecting ribosome stability and mRNA decay